VSRQGIQKKDER